MTGSPAEGQRRLQPGKGPPILPNTGWTAPLATFMAAVMAFLSVLTLAAALGADAVASQWRADLTGVATVRLSVGDGDVQERLEAVLEVLRTTPGIARVQVLDADEQRALLTPWLGEGIDIDDLPAPQLIDVVLTGRGPDAEALQGRLDLTVSGAVYDDHVAWRAPLLKAAGRLEVLAIGASTLVILTLGAIVAFAARATLLANRHVVETVRLVGAEDRFISSAFIGRLVQRAALGSGVGALIGVGALWLMPEVDAADPALRLALKPSAWQLWALVGGVPLLSVLVTWLAARTAVGVTLRALP